MRILHYRQYKWIYLLGTALTLVNATWLHQDWLTWLCLALLYCILHYKGIHILRQYGALNRTAPIDKTTFARTYGGFRTRVALFWLTFIALCVVAKFTLHLGRLYFYGCTFFFLFLDRWFVNVICLLQKLSDPRGTVVRCCCGCPCRGWDLLMIHTPLLFALSPNRGLENALILLSSALGFLSFFCWEAYKYHLVEVRDRCATPCDLKLCKEHRG